MYADSVAKSLLEKWNMQPQMRSGCQVGSHMLPQAELSNCLQPEKKVSPNYGIFLNIKKVSLSPKYLLRPAENYLC